MADVKPLQPRNRITVAGKQKIHYGVFAVVENVIGRFSNPGNSLLLVAPIVTSTFGGTSNCERTRTSILRFS